MVPKDPDGSAFTEPKFAGRIARTVQESTAWWPDRTRAKRPNLVVVVLDDVGFAQLGCFGSSIATPMMDALAMGGLRYTNFHVTPLCSPTRACLLTGRNHHSVGMGFLAAFDTGFPAYRGSVTPAAATIAEILRGDGYGTYAAGKWHLAPPDRLTSAGPYDQWPNDRGFDRFYGFLWGEDDQFSPELWLDRQHVEVPDRPNYHLSADLVERSARFLDDHLTARPDDPFLLYLAFGACHAPHQAPPEYIERYRGRFDAGWDVEREKILQRQQELGVLPPQTRLAPANPGVSAWKDLSPDQRRLCARFQEAFAGFMTHTDEQIGRLVDYLRKREVLDDTVIVLLSDNGASGEGGAEGTLNEYRYFLRLPPEPLNEALKRINDIGTPAAHNHYPSGWAQAGNTPFRYFKKYTHNGGVRVPMIISTPKTRERQAGEIRAQFHHAIDITPTLLELAGSEAPSVYHDVSQLPMHGRSMTCSFDDASAPSSHTTQYFEMVGNRGIYDNGWKAVVAHEAGTPYDDDVWELFDLTADPSESNDLAAAEPERLAHMIALWEQEAEQYGVFPLDDRMTNRATGVDPRTDKRRYVLRPGARLLNLVVGPDFSGRAFTVTARPVCGPETEGVLLAQGRRANGFAVFVKGGRLMADVNIAGDHVLLSADDPLTPGRHTLTFSVTPTDRGASAQLCVDGVLVADAALSGPLPRGLGTLSLQCGENEPSAVSTEYRAPFRFTGELDEVIIDLGVQAGSPDRRAAAEMMAQ
jgi:arylsulfatase